MNVEDNELLAVEKRRAYYRVGLAVENGELEKPEKCTRCGFETDELDAHHPDYSRPLDVEWLCRRCHKREHGRIRREIYRAEKVAV